MKIRKAIILLAAVPLLVACSTVGGGGGATTAPPTTAAPGSSAAVPEPSKMTMITVVKLTGDPWFDRMEVGVKAFAARTGVDARQEGGDDATPEKQVAIIQNLIAQKPTAITVVPNSPESLETVLGQAMAQGIIVVSHEAAGLKNTNIDIEPFDNAAYGASIMDNLAGCMNNSGGYVTFVGHLTAKTHMQWSDGALAEAQAKFPDIKRLEDPIESNESEQTAYEKAKEILAKYPDIKGFQGSASGDVLGIARAVSEVGKSGKICVMGTSTPAESSKWIKDGSIQKVFFWDPAMAGEAQLQIALLLAQGQKVGAGTDLGIEGYHSLLATEWPNVFVGNAVATADKTNVDTYAF